MNAAPSFPMHHPSDALLVAYGAGCLGEGLALAVATHLALCPACRATARTVDALGGALLEAEEGMALARGALDRTLAVLDGARAVPAAAPVRQPAGLFPHPLAGYVGDDPRWQRLAPGVRRMKLLGGRAGVGGAAQMLRVAPGVALPHHGHGGLEVTVVLSGWFADENGRYGPGDVAEVDCEIRHRPVADTCAECVCLIATDAPLRFTGILGRLAQPFIGL